jgi:hypothetical protein
LNTRKKELTSFSLLFNAYNESCLASGGNYVEFGSHEKYTAAAMIKETGQLQLLLTAWQQQWPAVEWGLKAYNLLLVNPEDSPSGTMGRWFDSFATIDTMSHARRLCRCSLHTPRVWRSDKPPADSLSGAWPRQPPRAIG